MWRSTPLWTALAAAVALAALAACSGDSPPPAPPAPATPTAIATPTAASTPTATVAATATPSRTATPVATPMPTVTPTPTPTAEPSPTPVPCPALECVEPALEAFEHRIFESGEEIDWSEGIFLMNTETGRINAYRVHGEANNGAGDDGDGSRPRYGYFFVGSDNRWIVAVDSTGRLLLDREENHVWRLPRHLGLEAASQDRLLLWDSSGSDTEFVLASPGFAEIQRFEYLGHAAFFSPDGRKLLYGTEDAIFVMDLETLTRDVILEIAPHEEWGVPDAVDFSPAAAAQEIHVQLTYPSPGPTDSWKRAFEWYRFNWDGEELSRVTTPEAALAEASVIAVSHSPDGRYVAWQQAGLHIGFYEASEAWPSVVVADAGTGEPLFRVRSASLQFLDGGWLPGGDGLVLRTVPAEYGQAGAMLVRIRPRPAIERLPSLPGAAPNWPFLEGMLAAPVGDGRFFAETYTKLWEGPRAEITALYDAHQDRWHTATLISGHYYGAYDYLRPSWPSWGTSDRELRLTFSGGKATGGGIYLFGWPSIEFPPFSDEFAFRVARTGSCLYLRETPEPEGTIRGCLPDGTRVALSESLDWAGSDWDYHPSVAGWFGNDRCCDHGVYVRTADGLEGWVAHEYLDHD